MRESCAQVSALQQREREREIQREREKEQERISQPYQRGREKDRDAEEQRDSKLEVKLRELQDKGLVRLEKTASGSLDIEVIPVTVVQTVPVSVTETGMKTNTFTLELSGFYSTDYFVLFIRINILFFIHLEDILPFLKSKTCLISCLTA